MMEYVDFVEPDFNDGVAELETGKQSAAAPAEAQKTTEQKKEGDGNGYAGQEAEQPEKIIVNLINERLMEGGMSAILQMPILTEEISGSDISLGNMTFWRLSRTEVLADVEVSARFTIADRNGDYTTTVGMYITLWYDSEEGFFGELYEMGSIENRPDRSYWKLDPYMAPYFSKDSVEQAGEEQWRSMRPAAMRDAGERKAKLLADEYGLSVVSMRLAGCPAQDHVLFFEAGTMKCRIRSRHKRWGNSGVKAI